MKSRFLWALPSVAALVCSVAAAEDRARSSDRATQDRYEFRGWVAENDLRIFNIYDAEERYSFWLELAKPGGPVVVRSFDSIAESIVLEVDVASVSLVLKKARIGLSSSPALDMPADVGTPDSRVYAAALEREIRRRRELQEMVRQMVESEAGDNETVALW